MARFRASPLDLDALFYETIRRFGVDLPPQQLNVTVGTITAIGFAIVPTICVEASLASSIVGPA